MSEETTKTSNDESRKEANVKNVSEAEIQKHLDKWGKVYIAAINPEFAAEVLNHAGGNAFELKVESKAAKYIEDLKKESMNIGTKEIKTPNAKKAREVAKKKTEKRIKEAEARIEEDKNQEIK